MSGARRSIRSYQRVFRPDRRLHSVEGRALPVPGGVPLRGLAYAGGALGAVLVLGTRSVLVYLALALCAAAVGASLGGRQAALAAGTVGLLGCWVLGHLLGALDWPIRLGLIPGAVATLGTQVTPDGRPAHRFAAAWLALRLRPRRRSLGRALPTEDLAHTERREVWVAPDHRSPVLRRSRITGEGEVGFLGDVSAHRPLLRRNRIVVSASTGEGSATETLPAWLTVVVGETVEVRP